MKTDKLEGDSSGVYSKKSCSNLGCLDLGECAKILGRPTWTSLMVDLGRFGCNCGGDLKIFLTLG
jgi:hypothetical protein